MKATKTPPENKAKMGGTLMHKNLRWLLSVRGRSASDVSIKAGRARSTVQAILDNPTRHPRGDTITALARELGITTLQLIDVDLKVAARLGQFDPETDQSPLEWQQEGVKGRHALVSKSI